MLEVITIKDVKIQVGQWCRRKRLEQELSQENLAQALCMSRVTIQQLEAGRNVTLDTLLKVANHFNSLQAIYSFFEDKEADLKSLY